MQNFRTERQNRNERKSYSHISYFRRNSESRTTPLPLPRVFHVGGIVTVPQSYSRRFENFDLLVTFGYFEKECVQSILSSSESISLELKVLNAN